MQSPDFTIANEPNDMLESLTEIPIRGFLEIEAQETPTTATTSLPTPGRQEAALPLDQTEEPPPETPVSRFLYDDAYADFDCDDIPAQQQYPPLECPGAPLMKEYDSFTDGTGKGSFDSIPAADTDEFGQTIHPINALSLASLPPRDTSLTIVLWRDHVFVNTPHASPVDVDAPSSEVEIFPTSASSKRPRSTTSVDDEGAQRRTRTRVRAQSLSSAASAPINSFFWTSAESPASAGGPGRCPSRANSTV